MKDDAAVLTPEAALSKVEDIVNALGDTLDRDYFDFHRARYLRMAKTIARTVPSGGVLLNIGSHYLHTSLLFDLMGYQVVSMDVGVFWEIPFVKARAEEYNVLKIIENDLENLPSHERIESKYDAVLFAEILEHITFNPIAFWKKIHSVIKDSGLIYISTPNSLNLYNSLRTITRVLTFRGVGIPIGSIFSNVTYGHHWKEYSSSEIRKYFRMLSDDFHVDVSFYHYRKANFQGGYASLMSIISILGNALYLWSDEIEATIRVNKKSVWKLSPPAY